MADIKYRITTEAMENWWVHHSTTTVFIGTEDYAQFKALCTDDELEEDDAIFFHLPLGSDGLIVFIEIFEDILPGEWWAKIE
jgi:hypothetical protein